MDSPTKMIKSSKAKKVKQFIVDLSQGQGVVNRVDEPSNLKQVKLERKLNRYRRRFKRLENQYQLLQKLSKELKDHNDQLSALPIQGEKASLYALNIGNMQQKLTAKDEAIRSISAKVQNRKDKNKAMKAELKEIQTKIGEIKARK